MRRLIFIVPFLFLFLFLLPSHSKIKAETNSCSATSSSTIVSEGEDFTVTVAFDKKPDKFYYKFLDAKSLDEAESQGVKPDKNPYPLTRKGPKGFFNGIGISVKEPKDNKFEAMCVVNVASPVAPCAKSSSDGKKCEEVGTAIGNISTEPAGFVGTIFSLVLGLAGGIAVLLIIISGYKLMSSRGNPEQLQAAREQLTAAIVGLLFIIFSFVILQIIGVDILRLPGFGG